MNKDEIHEHLSTLANSLNKKYGNKVVRQDLTDNKKLSTGSLYLDWAFNGGYVKGSTIIFKGLPGSSKSSMGCVMMAEAQRNDEVCALINLEKGLDRGYMQSLGVDTEKLWVVDGLPCAEAYYDNILEMVNVVDFIMVDSVTSLAPQGSMERKLEDSHQMATMAKLNSEFFQKFQTMNKTTTLLLIGQVREKFNSRLPSYYMTGGKAIIHAANYIVETKLKTRLDDEGKEVGKDLKKDIGNDVTTSTISMYTEKCRRGISHRTAEITLDHTTGQIDKFNDIMQTAKRYNLIRMNGSWIYFLDDNDEEQKLQSTAFKIYLEENEDFRESMIYRIKVELGFEINQKRAKKK